ncbi:MAG: thioredoxin family protein [Amphritea sp.]
MAEHKSVSSAEWLAARKELLIKEKQFTRLRDELSQTRRELPWEKVESDYLFDTASGKQSLAELFEGSSQLIVYHFMYGPDWDEGCPSCSFWADNYKDIAIHLKQRDIAMVTISRAPLDKLEAYKKRMGWQFNWVSSGNNDFNSDYQVSFSQQEIDAGEVVYNYQKMRFPSTEAPGISVFYKNEKNEIFHTYSCYARGLDMLNGAYHLMDLTPKGRDEDELTFPMAWVKRHDCY